MLIYHKGHTDTIQVYSVTVMTHVKALQAGHSSQGTSEPITPAWFRHFRAVADVHGWNKDQRALQLVSYLDETAMNVAQELGDADLYNYDVLVKLLSDRFDPASRVSACRSRFHGRSRRHHEDADTFADALSELCRVGYPQSPAELRQELIA